MAIDISKAANGLFNKFEDSVIPDSGILGGRMGRFLTPAVVKGNYIVDGTMVYVNANINVDIEFNCDKCLAPIKRKINVKFDVTYYLDGKEAEGDYSYNNYTIDFAEGVSEQILLSLPSRVVCREDCKGFCTICGCNLNETTCDCVKEEVVKDMPFSALKNFFDKTNKR